MIQTGLGRLAYGYTVLPHSLRSTPQGFSCIGPTKRCIGFGCLQDLHCCLFRTLAFHDQSEPHETNINTPGQSSQATNKHSLFNGDDGKIENRDKRPELVSCDHHGPEILRMSALISCFLSPTGQTTHSSYSCHDLIIASASK